MMLFQFQGRPQRLLRLIKLFKGMAPRLRGYRSAYGRAVALASAFYGLACALVLFWADADTGELFWFFAGCGAAFLLWAWVLASVLQRYPRNRKIAANQAAIIIVTLALAFIAYTSLDKGLEWLDVAAGLKPQALAMWGLASLGVFVSSRWIVWLRLKEEMIVEDELDFLYALLVPLLRDLPADTACAFSCNPFTPIWSEKLSVERHGRYSLHISDDVLLDFKARLGDDASLALQTVCRRVDKYKSNGKKTKFKGTKHRVAMVCRFQHPALARLGENEIQQLGQVCENLQGHRQGYAMTVRRDLAAGKITCVGKGRFSGPGELKAADLPDARGVLATVRALSAFTARLGPAQNPA